MNTGHAPTHRVAAFVVVRDAAGRVLLSRRRDSGWYNLPGGGVEPHESVAEGALREVREETGLEVTLRRLVGLYSKPQKCEIVAVFEAEVCGGALQPSDEADVHVWIAPDELARYQVLPKHRERILDALRGDAAAVVRDQREPSLWAAPEAQPDPR